MCSGSGLLLCSGAFPICSSMFFQNPLELSWRFHMQLTVCRQHKSQALILTCSSFWDLTRAEVIPSQERGRFHIWGCHIWSQLMSQSFGKEDEWQLLLMGPSLPAVSTGGQRRLLQFPALEWCCQLPPDFHPTFCSARFLLFIFLACRLFGLDVQSKNLEEFTLVVPAWP